MSNESTVWINLTENSTGVSFEPGKQQDGYVLLLVLLSIFLVLLSVLLIICRRCCDGDCRHARASDDPEKTNTSYMEESQPVHGEITIRVDESDCLSAASSHMDMETERFLSTGTQGGRRVSFNESALFDHGKKAQEKGRRFTLTEGDFHHLKNARLTHLHIPPLALKIVTIHECESSENSIAMTTRPAAKSSLSIFQPALCARRPQCPLPQTALTSLSVSPSSALPGDTLNSVVDTSFSENPPAPGTKEPSISSIEVMVSGSRNGGSPSLSEGASVMSVTGASPGTGVGQGPVLQFFTKLRRHASLEGASPYFKIKKWKLDSSQRASSLDTRGSPKRRQFQRQRAASESMDQEDSDAHHIDLIQYIARTQDATYRPSVSASTCLLPHTSPSTPPHSLGRLEVEVVVEPSCSRGQRPEVIGLSPEPQDEAASQGDCRQESSTSDHQALYRDIWTLRSSLEQYGSSDQISNNRSDADSVCSLGGRTKRGGLPSYPSQDIGDGDEPEGDVELPVDEGMGEKEKGGKQDSLESERGSDGESGNRKLMQMDSGYTSIEAPSRAPEELRLFGSSGSMDRLALEKRHYFTSAGSTGTVGESFEARIFEEEPDEETPAGATGGVTIETDRSPLGWSPYGQMFTPQEAQPHPHPPLSIHRRDYSIDEKTDALFHEFLRHDPQFDQQETPKKHRSRIHLRKQWQRHKQYSDPGVRYQHHSFERQRNPLRRGDSVNYPLDTGYHSTLPRIVSAPDEEASEGVPSTPQTPKAEAVVVGGAGDAEVEEGDRRRESLSSTVTIRDDNGRASCSPPPVPEREGLLGEQPNPQEDPRLAGHPPEPPDEPPQPPDKGYGPQTITAELTDKLSATLDERLYTGLRQIKDTAVVTECVVTDTHASPDHSPV
ncbi:voltage-dependent calcium channel beta subunit-associated regulatory protein [Coregonus clupeaformis]|uniref:voltage-dependent calcium channel beta subunit-associated regulatory protein n=1 Tax=Coregonus clupeaformis TaxID=59861 RepID=UPI001E1C4CAA|nr:voltage-dependent calcium channel beta subunit-associated regulatory protein [Coregonus clupeaformis]XP_041746126.2 voltage-dependent calcium channel beta subunit-associated regulatory protein [Coregonus clupeaformis]XP_041746127.2 voltage-dependent calcium channel beta subunit-associated regulatory protein [Coregonus clupeaformis]